MHYLVTGGAGFIGSHLCELLVSNGHHVTAVDNLSSGSEHNLRALRDDRSVAIHRGSLMEMGEGEIAGLIDLADVVVHLAASVGVESIARNYINTIRNNFISTDAIVRVCAQRGKRLLISSTSEVYGSLGPSKPFSEDGPLSMESPLRSRRGGYACSKALGEYLALSYYDSCGLPVTIARIFNATGPRQSAESGMVVPRFVSQAIRNAPLTVFGSGNQSRCFSHVKDVCRAIVLICERPETAGEIYNIGNDSEINILTLAKTVIELIGSSSEIKFAPLSEGRVAEVYRRVPNLAKIRAATGYQPSFGVREIVADVQAYMKETQAAR
jgi:UDP-glucose 4-epimerase